MHQTMLIRSAKEEDSDSIFTLANQLSTAVEINKNSFEKLFPAMLQDRNQCCLVMCVGEAVVGYASGYTHHAIYANGPVAYLDEIVVTEGLRGQGIGGKLITAFENWAKEQGCRLVGLATGGARPFYEQLGYGSKAGYYKKYLD